MSRWRSWIFSDSATFLLLTGHVINMCINLEIGTGCFCYFFPYRLVLGPDLVITIHLKWKNKNLSEVVQFLNCMAFPRM